MVYEQAGHCYHHSALMVNVDIGNLSKHLAVSKEKLTQAFEKVYRLKASKLRQKTLDMKKSRSRGNGSCHGTVDL